MILVIILSIFAFILSIAVFGYCLFTLIGLITARGVPFVPLSRKHLETLGRYIKLNPDDRIVDLGCGNGRVLRMFEKQGVKNLTGYEVNFLAYLLAKFKNKISKSQAKIYFKNFKNVDLSEYNVIFCYLFPGCINSLKEKFNRELKLGAKIISCAFEIKNWRKPEVIYLDDKNKKEKLFVYRI